MNGNLRKKRRKEREGFIYIYIYIYMYVYKLFLVLVVINRISTSIRTTSLISKIKLNKYFTWTQR